MTDDLVARLRADELPGDRQRQIEARIELWKILQEAADRIEWMQDIIARIQYTNLRQDINAESRTIEIEKLCKGKPNE
jgi:hypothetical protein